MSSGEDGKNFQKMEIRLSEFPTHIQLSKNKWIKFSGNAIYSGVFWRKRHIIYKRLHEWLVDNLPDFKASELAFHLDFQIPVNWSAVRRTQSKGISWTPPKPDYEPTWDLDNLEYPWRKAIQDALVLKKIIPDDNIRYIHRDLGAAYTPVETFEDRAIVLTVKYIPA